MHRSRAPLRDPPLAGIGATGVAAVEGLIAEVVGSYDAIYAAALRTTALRVRSANDPVAAAVVFSRAASSALADHVSAAADRRSAARAAASGV